MKIIRVPIAPLHMINAYMIVSESGVVIIDTGLPGSEKHFLKALADEGRRPDDVRLIIVTHAHVDHAGSAAALKRLTGAPLLAHRADLPHYRQERAMSYCPTGPFGRLFKSTGLIQAPYEAFEPDIVMDGTDDLPLNPFGVAGIARYTPGHTAGSISVLLDDRNVLVSDLISSGILLGGIVRLKSPKRPPFEDDPHLVADQLERLVEEGAKHFHVGHGATLGHCEVCRHIVRLRRL